MGNNIIEYVFRDYQNQFQGVVVYYNRKKLTKNKLVKAGEWQTGYAADCRSVPGGFDSLFSHQFIS